jgi:molecular chaperone GrpE
MNTDHTDSAETTDRPNPEPAPSAADPVDAGAKTDPQPANPPTSEPPELVALREQVAAAKTEAEQAQARLRAVSKAYNDLQGEMRSFRERMEARAKQDSELQAFEQVRAFFDPVMNLKRSVNAPGDDVKNLVEGLRMVHQQFLDSLKRLGLEEVPGEGSPFDPRLHEALATAPVTDQTHDGRVLQVLSVGYTVKGRVLQAAQVVIGKHAETAGEA